MININQFINEQITVGLGHCVCPGVDPVLSAACHGHPAHGGMRREEQGRRLSRVSAHHECLCAVAAKKLNPASVQGRTTHQTA